MKIKIGDVGLWAMKQKKIKNEYSELRTKRCSSQ